MEVTIRSINEVYENLRKDDYDEDGETNMPREKLEKARAGLRPEKVTIHGKTKTFQGIRYKGKGAANERRVQTLKDWADLEPKYRVKPEASLEDEAREPKSPYARQFDLKEKRVNRAIAKLDKKRPFDSFTHGSGGKFDKEVKPGKVQELIGKKLRSYWASGELMKEHEIKDIVPAGEGFKPGTFHAILEDGKQVTGTLEAIKRWAEDAERKEKDATWKVEAPSLVISHKDKPRAGSVGKTIREAKAAEQAIDPWKNAAGSKSIKVVDEAERAKLRAEIAEDREKERKFGEIKLPGDTKKEPYGSKQLGGDWVKGAKESGWWDNPEQLKGYLKDMEYDWKTAQHPIYPAPYSDELKGDISIVSRRIEVLEKESTKKEKRKLSEPWGGRFSREKGMEKGVIFTLDQAYEDLEKGRGPDRQKRRSRLGQGQKISPNGKRKRLEVGGIN